CAQRNYLPTLVNTDTDVVAVVDADVDGGRDRVEGLLTELSRNKTERLIVSRKEWEAATLAPETRDWLRRVRQLRQVDAALIVTEARSHAAYLRGTIELACSRLLLEKPVAVPGPRG